MPVSIDGRGSGVSVPCASRSYCMNTRFQISTKRSPGSSGKLPRARLRPEIVVDLRARPARPGLAHLPEVVFFVQPENAILRNARHLLPQLFRVIVFAKNRDVELVFRQSVILGDQLPRKRNRVSLEIIAKRKIAQHLEERMMPPRVADVIQVVVLAARPHAFLRARRARIIPLLLPQEHVFELVHPSVGKQQRRIVGRHQRRTAHHAVPAGREIVKELLANFGACHVGCFYFRLPADRFALVLLVEPFLERREVVQNRGGIETRVVRSARTWRPAMACSGPFRASRSSAVPLPCCHKSSNDAAACCSPPPDSPPPSPAPDEIETA